MGATPAVFADARLIKLIEPMMHTLVSRAPPGYRIELVQLSNCMVMKEIKGRSLVCAGSALSSRTGIVNST